MKKQIFVTVAEFLENGGIMVKDDGRVRQVFYQNGIELKVSADLYQDLVLNHPTVYYVQIPCTPLYI